MSRLARRVSDRRLLRIVRRFLEAGMLKQGVCVERYEAHSAGWAAIPLAGKPAAGWAGPGDGATGPPFLPLRGRLHRLSELNSFLSGWVTYFRHASGKAHLQRLDEWVRRKQRKRSRSVTDFLTSLGVPRKRVRSLGGSGRGWWCMAGSPPAAEGMNLRWFQELGLLSLTERYLKLQP